jgi:hypothetical protein
MSFWITVWCTNSLSPLTADDLRRGVEINDFAMIAENIDLTDAAEEALRFEPMCDGFRLHYRPEDPDWWIGMYRTTGAEARGYGQEAVQEILDGSEPTRVREVVCSLR